MCPAWLQECKFDCIVSQIILLLAARCGYSLPLNRSSYRPLFLSSSLPFSVYPSRHTSLAFNGISLTFNGFCVQVEDDIVSNIDEIADRIDFDGETEQGPLSQLAEKLQHVIAT